MKNSVVIGKSSRILLILLLLAACSPSTPALVTPTDMINTGDAVHTSTPNQVHSPTLTPIPTLSPTTLPLTTLSREQIIANVVALLETNAGCQLPCIWGITPGITTWAEAEQQLQQAGLTPSSERQGTSLVHYESLLIPATTVAEGMFTKMEFAEQNGVVSAIHLHGEGYYSPSEFKRLWTSYSPETIISNYGSPTRVWIKAVASASEGNPTSFPYELWLFYDPVGVLLRYSGTVDAKPIYQFCPTFSDSGNIGNAIDVYVVSTVGDKSPEDLTELKSMPYPPQSLDEAAGLTIEEFYRLFLQDVKPICFETPQNIWK